MDIIKNFTGITGGVFQLGLDGPNLENVSGDLNLNAQNLVINLGDSAAQKKVQIKDQSGAIVSQTDSDGNINCNSLAASGASSTVSSVILSSLPNNHLYFVLPTASKQFIFRNAASKDVNFRIETGQSIDSTPTDLLSFAIGSGEAWSVEAVVVGKKLDESQRGRFKLEGLFYRVGAGDVTQQGNTIVQEIESDIAWDANLVADAPSGTIDVRVTGTAATTINWQVFVTYFKV